MSLYQLVLFLHITSVLALTVASALQWLAVQNAASGAVAESLIWARLLSRLPAVVFPSLAGVLITGGYLSSRMHAFSAPWISFTFVAIVLIGASHGAAGSASRRLRSAAQSRNAQQAQQLAGSTPLVFATRLTLTLIVAITLLMVAHANMTLSVVVVGLGVLAAVFWSLGGSRKSHA